MPIELRTGLPGAGKTLGAVERLLELQKTEPERPRYVLGITDLRDGIAIPLTEAEFKGWKHLPAGSIVFVDEVQKYMPAKRGTQDSPQWIRDLSEHRHLGLDFVFITQHPSLIDTYVRKLVDRHIHTVRKYGTHNVERWRWPICVSDPNSSSAKKQSEQKSIHRYSKAAMAAYKSSELHTVKRTVPRFLVIGAVLFVAVPLLAWAAVHILRSIGGKAQPAATAAAAPGQAASAGQPAGAGKHVLTRDEWIAQRVPRVVGIPWSAPIYDDLKPQTTPDMFCASVHLEETGRDRCTCVSEQGTHLDVPAAICLSVVKNGIYNPYRRSEDQRSTAVQPPAPSSPVGASMAALGGSGESAGQGGRATSKAYTPPESLPWNAEYMPVK